MLLVLYRTLKCGCPVHISASVDHDKGKLVVLSCELQHSHATGAPIASSSQKNGQQDANDDCASDHKLRVARIDCSLLKDISRKPLTRVDIHNQRVLSKKAAAGGM